MCVSAPPGRAGAAASQRTCLIDGRRRGLPGTRLPLLQRGKALDGRSCSLHGHTHTHTCVCSMGMRRNMLSHTHKQRHTYAAAFPSLWQLLCQSGELITGKQICLGSPSRKHTRAHTYKPLPSSLFPKFFFQRRGGGGGDGGGRGLESLEQPAGWQPQPEPEARREAAAVSAACCPQAPVFGPQSACVTVPHHTGSLHTVTCTFRHIHKFLFFQPPSWANSR